MKKLQLFFFLKRLFNVLEPSFCKYSDLFESPTTKTNMAVWSCNPSFGKWRHPYNSLASSQAKNKLPAQWGTNQGSKAGRERGRHQGTLLWPTHSCSYVRLTCYNMLRTPAWNLNKPTLIFIVLTWQLFPQWSTHAKLFFFLEIKDGSEITY